MSGETGEGAARRHRGELLAALVAMGFGSAYVATSFALLALGPVPAAAWRCGLAAVFVGAVLRLIPAARTATFLLLNPITATVLAGVLLGERPTPLQVAGGVLVLLGMAAATASGGGSRLRR